MMLTLHTCTKLTKKTYVSTIDHFFWNNTASSMIMDAGVLHLAENLSDHSPIYCKMKMNHKKAAAPKTSQIRQNLNWKLGTVIDKDNYWIHLNENLNKIEIPNILWNCCNTNCKRRDHMEMIDSFMLEILYIIEQTGNKYIPRSTSKNNENKQVGSIPNWNDKIAPLKNDAQFWYSIWISAGRPINNTLHKLMKRTRNAYHLKIRQMKRLQNRTKRNKLLEACVSNNGDLFKEIKRLRKTKPTNACSIDGQTSNIPHHFATKYESLYTSVNDKTNLDNLEIQMECQISASSMADIAVITPELMEIAAGKLKDGKTDPQLPFTTDFLKHAPSNLYKLLCIALRSFITHGHVSDFLLVSNLVPIVKDKLASVTDSSNYRSIAISSIILKLFDWVIILGYAENLQLDDLQFGYQTNVSTAMCTWTAVETIEYYQRNGSDVFTCLMDMSKAFDTVRHSTLFKKLLKQGLPTLIVRFLIASYRGQRARVKWSEEYSDFFEITNGVKQGAVISSFFYCIYTNGLFEELRKQRIGCCIGSHYVGILGYADDLFLLCPTLDGLQHMLRICERYAKEHNLSFSTDPNPQKSKTKCLAFLLKDRALTCLNLCNNDLPWVSSAKHLGTKLENRLNNILAQDIKEKRAQYIQRNNELCQEFAFAHWSTKVKINNIYNTHFTGSVLWDLLGKDADMIYNTWNVSIRKMMRLDRQTHRHFVEPLSKTRHIKLSLLKRFLTFTDKVGKSIKGPVKTLFETIKDDCRSLTGRNLRGVMLLCGKNKLRRPIPQDLLTIPYKSSPAKDYWKLDMLEELIHERDFKEYELGWNHSEISDCIEELCIS